MSDYNTTYAHNEALALSHLQHKLIIHSVQYISNEETQIDGDGPESSWNQSFLSIEKTENDFIFHFFRSDYFQAYSYPYFKLVKKFHHSIQKLSDLEKQFSNMFSNSYNNITNFIRYLNEDLCYALNTNDTDLNNKIATIFSKIDDLENIADEKYKIKKQTEDKEREEYEKSDDYKQYLQYEEDRKMKEKDDYEKKEAERLAFLIEKYGEIDGPKYMRL
jgi:hypothetical protein